MRKRLSARLLCANWRAWYHLALVTCNWTILQLQALDDVDNEIDDVLTNFESKCQRALLHTVMFY
jgi:hypothetical protein